MWPTRIPSSVSMNEERWLLHISQTFTITIDDPCVFEVPKNEKVTYPEVYAPKKLGLGPYQHFQEELYPRESQKRAAAKDFLKPDQFMNFKDLVVKRLNEIESTIRACYNRYVDLEGMCLAWVLGIDSVFLLHFIRTYVDSKDKGLVDDPYLEQLARDVLVLENQIPIKILREILTALQISMDDYPLLDHFYRFCKEQSPLELADSEEIKNDLGPNHLLHYMYHLIVNNSSGEKRLVETDHQVEGDVDTASHVSAIADIVISQGRDLVNEAVKEVTNAIQDATSSGIKFPGKINAVSGILQTVHKSLSSLRDKGTEENYEINHKDQEIDVPSAAQLSNIAKIKFMPISGGIRDIRGEREEDNIVYLPVITLRANSDVVLRNLLAYEAAKAEAAGSIQLELTHYVDLMCGLVDSPEDLNLLKNVGIIKGDLRDEEMLKIFNGFKKSTGKSNVKSRLERIADRVSKKFHRMGIVKASKCIRKCFDNSKKLLNRLLPLMLFAVLGFQLYRELGGLSGKGSVASIFDHS